MKAYVFTALFLTMFSTTVFAATNASPFGFELGVATRADVQRQLASKVQLSDIGFSAVTHGRMVETGAAGLGVEGLDKAVFVFDAQDRLAGLQLTFPKDFGNASTRKTADVLKQKYREVQRDLPIVGDGMARYVQGDSVVLLESPHMSFVYTVTYMTNGMERGIVKHDADQRARKAAATKAAL